MNTQVPATLVTREYKLGNVKGLHETSNVYLKIKKGPTHKTGLTSKDREPDGGTKSLRITKCHSGRLSTIDVGLSVLTVATHGLRHSSTRRRSGGSRGRGVTVDPGGLLTLVTLWFTSVLLPFTGVGGSGRSQT